jgi:hypothetical protein
MNVPRQGRNAIILLLALAGNATAAVFTESASLRTYAVTLRDQSLLSSDSYQAPTDLQRTQFSQMATHIAAGNLIDADTIALTLGYEVVNFTDTFSNREFYLLREATVANKVINGWGSYFYNPNSTRSVLIEAPHIRFDTHSYDVATVAFRQSDASALMFNGADRNSNGNNASDVAHLATSIFQTVHETWTTSAAVQAWQIHGFNIENHNTIPAGTDVVLSNGDGSVSQEVKNLDAAFQNASFINDAESIAHDYNTLDMSDPDNVEVNGNISGSKMASLGATTNVQGIFTRSLGGTFVHIELEQSIRLDGTLAEDLANRETAGNVVANAIQAVPEPSSAGLLLLTGLGFLLSRNRR